MTQVTDIWSLVEPYLAAESLELDDLELTGRGPGRVVRVIVDGPEVNIDRLAELSRGLKRLLDNETDLRDQYQLEVSSPGLERKLRRPCHYIKSIGREAKVKVADGEAKVTLRGVIRSADAHGFVLDGDHGSKAVPYEDVIAANTVFRWEKTPKPGH